MAKLKPNEKRVQLSFQRPEDLKLFEFIQREAYRCRWDIPTFCIASLQEAFKDRIDEEDVDAIAEEASRKVRERAVALVGTDPKQEPPPWGDNPTSPPTQSFEFDKPAPVSMDVALNQAEQQIASLNPPGMKLKRGKVNPPEMPLTK